MEKQNVEAVAELNEAQRAELDKVARRNAIITLAGSVVAAAAGFMVERKLRKDFDKKLTELQMEANGYENISDIDN